MRDLGAERKPNGHNGHDLLDLLSSGTPAAFAVDQDHRVVFWNRGAERLLGRPAAEALGRRCHDIVAGRDPFGNRFCHGACAVVTMLQKREAIQGFDLDVPCAAPSRTRLVSLTILEIPGGQDGTFTAVHILQPVDASSRLASVLARLGKGSAAPAPLSVASAPRPQPAAPQLTDRETQILGWIAAGLQNKEIAQQLEISVATVRNHVHNVLEKLGVHSKLEAVSLSFRNGWTHGAPVPPPPVLAAAPALARRQA